MVKRDNDDRKYMKLIAGIFMILAGAGLIYITVTADDNSAVPDSPTTQEVDSGSQ